MTSSSGFQWTGMSIFKLIQIGNSVGVILTKELLARLDLEERDIVFVREAANGAVMLSPHSPEFESQMLAAQCDEKAVQRLATAGEVSHWIWLDPAVLRAVHEQQLAEDGGASSTCNAGRLVSALPRPENLAGDGACVPTKLAVAASDMSEDDFEAWIRAHLQARQAKRSVTVPLR